MKEINPKIFLISLTAWALLVGSFLFASLDAKAQVSVMDPYVTSYQASYTYYTDDPVWVTCSWANAGTIHHCGCDNVLCSDGYSNSNAGSCSGTCDSHCGVDGVYSAFLRNTCSGTIICNNTGIPDAGGYWRNVRTPHTGYYTAYDCHYATVSSWSACSGHSQYATGVTWNTTSGTSCSNAPMTQYCNTLPVATITAPANNSIYTYGDDIAMSGSGSDADGDAITGYEWRSGNCSTGALVSSGAPAAGQDSFSSAANTSVLTKPGSYTLYLRVKDDQGGWSTNCPSVGITVRSSCIGSTPINSDLCTDDETDVYKSSPSANVSRSAVAKCTSKKCEYLCQADTTISNNNCYKKIYGNCGDASGKTFCSTPTADDGLCISGSPTAVTLSNNQFSWGCNGAWGGSSTKAGECKAKKDCAWKEKNPN